MEKVDIRKKMREAKWTIEHTLSKEQLKELIDKKTSRARKEMELRTRCSKQLLRA
jgi:F0F1-type ATP synthase delta subunit